jgi:hypothetical protein
MTSLSKPLISFSSSTPDAAWPPARASAWQAGLAARRRMAEVACGHFRFPRQLLRILVESLGKKCTSTRFGGNGRIVRFW